MMAVAGIPAMYCLLEMVAVAHDFFAPQFTKELDWIKVHFYAVNDGSHYGCSSVDFFSHCSF